MQSSNSLPSPSRRTLLASAGALPVAAAPVVPIAAPAGYDAELIRVGSSPRRSSTAGISTSPPPKMRRTTWTG
jgi:hypothetical protein